VPPKKKQRKSQTPVPAPGPTPSTEVHTQSRSQPAQVRQPSSQAPSQNLPRSQTIPMPQVVTETVPPTGRMKWYLWGSKNQAEDVGQGGNGAE
jgi:hypothetical protein